jgi:hypothetical protein
VSAGSDSTYSWCSFVSRQRCRVRLPRCPSRERREIFDVIAADLPPPHSHRHLLAAAPPYPSRESWVRAWGGGAAVPNDFSSAFPNQIWPQVGITDQFTLTCDDGNMRRRGQQRCYLCPPPPPPRRAATKTGGPPKGVGAPPNGFSTVGIRPLGGASAWLRLAGWLGWHLGLDPPELQLRHACRHQVKTPPRHAGTARSSAAGHQLAEHSKRNGSASAPPRPTAVRPLRNCLHLPLCPRGGCSSSGKTECVGWGTPSATPA